MDGTMDTLLTLSRGAEVGSAGVCFKAGFTDAEVEVVKTYSKNDVQALIPNDVVAQLGQAGITELMSLSARLFELRNR
jgi:hypothetical protein